MNRQPFVGEIVSYYPDQHTRFAAIVVEVSRDSVDSKVLPKVNLTVLNPDGTTEFGEDIEPAQSDGSSWTILEDRWSFAHEYYLNIEDPTSEDILPGTKSNYHVGQVATSY
jgi:hypothetical protein